MKQKTKTEVKTLETTKKKQWVKPKMTVMNVSNASGARPDMNEASS